MREFDQFRAHIAPASVVPGSVTTGPGTQLGDQAVGTTYTITQGGWDIEVVDPGKVNSASVRDSGAYYAFKGCYRNVFEWTPWAREDFALIPLGQDIAEGTNFRSFHANWAEEEIELDTGKKATWPAWTGVDCRVLDVWSSEKIEKKMLENLAWNGFIPGSEPAYTTGDVYTTLNRPLNAPDTIAHKLRLDQVISARYRQMVSSSNAPTAQYLGGQLMTIHDSTIGGNASISDQIHHARYVYVLSSQNGDDELKNPATALVAGSGNPTFNYAKVGWFIPSAMDTLTFNIEKIESDAQWATIARRGVSR